MTLFEHATRLQELAAGPTIFEAVDTYYHDDVTIVEANGDTFHGAETQKGRIQEWMASVEEIHSSEIKGMAAHETSPGTGVVFVEVAMDISFKGMGRGPFEEVAVQRWEDGKVVHERFYYNVPDMGDPSES